MILYIVIDEIHRVCCYLRRFGKELMVEIEETRLDL